MPALFFARLRSRKTCFWLILLLALGIRLAFVSSVHVPLNSDMLSFHNRALALVERGSFGANQLDFLATSTYRPPLYPIFLAIVYRLFGCHPEAAYGAQCLLFLLMLAGVYQLGKLVTPASFNRQAVGLTAMTLCAFYPPLIGYCGILLSETLFMTLLVWAVYWLLRPDFSRKAQACSGLLFGLACLTRPITLPLLLGLLTLAVLSRYRRFSDSLVVLLTFFLCLSPWTLRNYLEFHEFVLVDNSSGVNMVAGNNDDAKGDYTPTYTQSWMYRNAIQNSRTVVEWDRQLLANDRRWIAAHPQKYWKLFLKRLGYYFVSEHEFYAHEYHWNQIPWHQTGLNLTFRLLLQVIALFTLIGCLVWRNPTGGLLAFSGFFFYIFPAIAMYYTRYRHPGIPFVFTLAALGICVAASTLLKPRSEPLNPRLLCTD